MAVRPIPAAGLRKRKFTRRRTTRILHEQGRPRQARPAAVPSPRGPTPGGIAMLEYRVRLLLTTAALLAAAAPAALAAGTTERVSVSSTGVQGNGDSGDNGLEAVSPDGRFVAFDSAASNLVTSDTNGKYDVFVRDLQAGTTERVSVSSSGAQATGASFGSLDPSISAHGRFVAFFSDATDLVPGDTNGATDIFVRDRAKGTTERVSVGPHGRQANGDSSDPSISADGRF